MNFFASLIAIALISITSAGIASADTVKLTSYGNTASAPAGTSNSPLSFVGGSGATYNIGTNGIWAGPVGGSSWVAQNPGDCPGCGNIEVNGTYSFLTTFVDLSPATSTGYITLLADDTVSVYLNGSLIVAAAEAVTNGMCTVGPPNCTTPTTYALTSFISGTNTLRFDVQQLYGGGTGVDFEGMVNTSAVPEPNSLILVGTALLGTMGVGYRRIQA